MKTTWRSRLMPTLAGWTVALAMFFPIFWMFLTGFKTEITAVATPPAAIFRPTLENYSAVLQRADTSSSPLTASWWRWARPW